MENFYLDNKKLIKSKHILLLLFIQYGYAYQLDISNFNKTIGAIRQEGNHWVSLISINPKIYEINIAVANMK